MEIQKNLESRLRAHGLDLVQAFDAAWYNDAILARAQLPPLPLFSRQGALAFLIGNTRALWPRFVSAYRADAELQAAPHPLDRFVVETLRSCTDFLPIAAELRFSHEGGSRFVSMLHLAEASGLAKVGPVKLAIHPEHGPWFGLRAVLVVDAAAPKSLSPWTSPCTGCAAPCRDEWDRVASLSTSITGRDAVAPTWRDWVAVRDACPVGKASRYGEAQLRYHGTKDRSVLAASDGA